ncbi:MAG: 50S ribosomal protein L30 [Deltaproteobacteria bacterium]|nr:50S ribosomal protein L30 [Deltaproteobacteria bacterium]MBW2070336.1 50S ribosomal protein L30 [Deltaproteobacteria bacterium]
MTRAIEVTLIRSMVGRPRKHRRVLKSLGLTRMHKTVTLYDTPQIMGAVRKVQHLVKVKPVS